MPEQKNSSTNMIWADIPLQDVKSEQKNYSTKEYQCNIVGLPDSFGFENLNGQIRIGYLFYATKDIVAVRIDAKKEKTIKTRTLIIYGCCFIILGVGAFWWGRSLPETFVSVAWILMLLGIEIGLIGFFSFIAIVADTTSEKLIYSVILTTNTKEQNILETANQFEAILLVKCINEAIRSV
ncbi:MAG: hypothetical protein LBE12_03535 [Planctomycetaceae bacterium]|jgi:hypothetical protein|nr:hypothetical protein [Planctomycetaceae bacterium]